MATINQFCCQDERPRTETEIRHILQLATLSQQNQEALVGRQVWSTFDVADSSDWRGGGVNVGLRPRAMSVRMMQAHTNLLSCSRSDGNEITFPAQKIHAMLAPQETTEYVEEQHAQRVHVCEAVRAVLG